MYKTQLTPQIFSIINFSYQLGFLCRLSDLSFEFLGVLSFLYYFKVYFSPFFS